MGRPRGRRPRVDPRPAAGRAARRRRHPPPGPGRRRRAPTWSGALASSASPLDDGRVKIQAYQITGLHQTTAAIEVGSFVESFSTGNQWTLGWAWPGQYVAYVTDQSTPAPRIQGFFTIAGGQGPTLDLDAACFGLDTCQYQQGGPPTAVGTLHPLPPARILDTRAGIGRAAGAVRPGRRAQRQPVDGVRSRRGGQPRGHRRGPGRRAGDGRLGRAAQRHRRGPDRPRLPDRLPEAVAAGCATRPTSTSSGTTSRASCPATRARRTSTSVPARSCPTSCWRRWAPAARCGSTTSPAPSTSWPTSSAGSTPATPTRRRLRRRHAGPPARHPRRHRGHRRPLRVGRPPRPPRRRPRRRARRRHRRRPST